jgi:small-conductance mechanosensitive channel
MSQLPAVDGVIETIDTAAITELDPLKDVTWLNQVVFGNSLYAYVLTAATFVVLWAVLQVLRRSVLGRLAGLARTAQSEKRGGAWHLLATLLGDLNPVLYPLLALYLALHRLAMPASLERGVKLLTLAVVTFVFVRILGELVAYLITTSRTAGRADDPVVRSTNSNISALVKFATWTAGILFLLDNAGFNISTFVAGLGIGGVAIALATQAILGDTFSSFAIALDKPFEVGDVINVDALLGTVEHIGLKTTRVRSTTGELLIFANSDLTKSRIKNFKKMAHRRVSFRVGIPEDTDVATLKRVPKLVADAVAAAGKTQVERVHFVELEGGKSIFEAAYFIADPKFMAFMDVQQDVLYHVLASLSGAKVKVAFVKS